MTYKTALFDWDGTIADSTGCIVHAVQKSFEEFGLAAPPSETILHYIGIPLPHYLPIIGGEAYEAIHAPDLIGRFKELYREHAHDMTRIFNGMHGLLSRLRDESVTMGIVSSKERPALHFSADILGICDFFASYVGFDCVQNGKPHPETVYTALEELGLPHSDDIIVIGDAAGDIEMGNRAGVKTCAVTWGAQDKETLQAAEPDYIAHTVSELEDILFAA